MPIGRVKVTADRIWDALLGDLPDAKILHIGWEDKTRMAIIVIEGPDVPEGELKASDVPFQGK